MINGVDDYLIPPVIVRVTDPIRLGPIKGVDFRSKPGVKVCPVAAWMRELTQYDNEEHG